MARLASPSLPGQSEVRDIAFRLAQLAADVGRFILDAPEEDRRAREKSDHTPVTPTDERAEARLIEGLAEILPGVPVVAEEETGGWPENVPERFLLVDPIDGTAAFADGQTDYTINIALIDQGRPVIGVVHAPALGRTYIGCGAGEAWRAVHAPGADPVAAGFTPIGTRTPGPRLLALASARNTDSQTHSFIAGIPDCERQALSSALKFALLAEGAADVYPRFAPTMEWDTAAGEALLHSAGGCVVDPQGAPLVYGKREANYRNGPFVAWGRRPAAQPE